MQSKGIVIVLSVLAALVAVLLAVNLINAQGAAVPVYVSGSGEAAADTVTVYGQGKVAISPDLATITFGYQNENADPSAAQEDNKAQMERIINAVKAAGVGDAGLQTVSYQVYHNNSRNKFTVSNMMQVKIGDIERTSGIIKAAYDAGANQFWDVRFDIVKRQEAYTDALHLAMERAREKAEKLAADEGRTVLEVASIGEGTENNSYYYSSPYTNFVAAPSSSSGGYTDGGISSGEMEISAIVNVTYRLN
jgi:Uncharacterized conserved protein